MSKATTKARILNEITNALASDSITPTIVGGILDEILELDTRPYKVYSALISQGGLIDPTVIILENTTGLDINWVRQSDGRYNGILSAPIDQNKAFPFIAQGSSYIARITSTGVSQFTIMTESSNDRIRTDDVLYNTPLEIRVYN